VEENPIVRAVNKKIADCEAFFFDAAVALGVNGISGDYVEFGSWGGNTLRMGYENLSPSGRHLWAFDSFEGLPEPTDPRDEHPGWRSGGEGQGGVEAFRLACDDHGIPRDAYTTVAGYFEDTLPPLGADGGPVDISLVYLDCNMYSSTVTALEFLEPRLKHGMILAFDDYYCWSPTDVSGERSAFLEFEAAHPEWNFFRYKEVNWGGVSFVVEDAERVRPR
jgi:O-methyltransferase